MKKNVVIIILCILLAVSLGYIAYEKVLTKQPKEIKTEEKKEETKKEDFAFDIKNKTNIQKLSVEQVDFYVSKEGNAYLALDESSLDENLNIDIKQNFNKLKSQVQDNEIKGYCNEKEDEERIKTACPKGDVVETIKLELDNVMYAYEINVGVDIYAWYIAFLKADGTISVLNLGSLLYDGKIEIENNFKGLKNIVTVVQTATTGCVSCSYDMIAIEKNGTEHTFY